MAEVAVRFDHVAHLLLQFLRTRKAAVALALPDQRAIDADLEIAARAGDQGNFAESVAEGLQQFLSHPAGAQQPVALGAVEDGDTGFVGHGMLLAVLPVYSGARPLGNGPTVCGA